MPGRARSQSVASAPRAATGKGEVEAPVAAQPVAALTLPAAGGKRLLWLGGLAALATIGIIEWPVALVVGAGTYVAERLTRDDVRRDLQRPS